MPTLRIEHPVPDFSAWKQAFESDPARRENAGVRGYQILRPVGNPNYVLIDLEFDAVDEAEGLLANMRKVWAGAGGQVSSDQRAQIVEIVETKKY